VVRDPDSVRPYAQILNESTCTLVLGDLDPERSHPEFAAYLLAIAERMAETGEILRAAAHLAPWWFYRTAGERAAFTRAAERSSRPDAALYRSIAAAIPWLARLRHRRLRPARAKGAHREIPGTGLLVPRAIEQEPDHLLEQVQRCASDALAAFYARHRGDGARARERLVRWLRDERPPLVITDASHRTVWDHADATATSRLLERLAPCGPVTVEHIRGDLACIADHSRRFLASLRDRDSLPPPDASLAQGGYSFLHHQRRCIGYNLDEPGIERLAGPGIPYARAMLGARTCHEWAHLAVDAGFVPRTADPGRWSALRDRFAGLLDQIIATLPRPVRAATAADRSSLAAAGSTASGLVDIFERRLPDFRANLLATRYESTAERETYVRQNIRPLAREYPPGQILRLLVRYVYELQYLGFSEMEDARAYFYEMTWFEADFFDTGILDEPALDALSDAAAALCRAHAVDETRFAEAS